MIDSQHLSPGGLSADELELLALLMEEEGLDLATPQTIFPRTQQTNLPLSFAQQRLWFLDQWDPGSAAYNIAFALRLNGDLNIPALQAALDTIMARHESLRTIFATVDGQPIQIITPVGKVPLPCTDVSALLEPERVAETERRVRASSQTRFDLARGPLFVTELMRLAPDEHLLLFAMHHIISDGWSSGVFQREMIALYTAWVQGRPSPLPPLAIQYADFALWQREWLQGAILARQLNYWQQQLAGLPVLTLPTDRPRPPIQSHRGAYESFSLPLATLTALDEVGKRYGTTLFMTLLAAFQVLLGRYSNQTDLAVGSPIANRDLIEVEPLIGFFINTLILRADLSGNPRFMDLLLATRETTLQAYAHQNVPFEQLVEVLRPERDPSRPPLFQVMFALQNLPQGEQELPDLTITPLRPASGASKFDMMVGLTATATGLRGNIEYSTDLFDRATIQRLIRHFGVLLAGIGTAHERRIADLPLLTPEERQHLLIDWNARSVALPAVACIHELITAQAVHTPDSIAVVSGNQSLTYRELNERANQLAHYLQRKGVGPEITVAICLDRSPMLIVAILAIWKADGAYLPLDPGFPRERLHFLLEDAEITVLVTEAHLLVLLQPEQCRHHAAIVCLDVEADQIAEQPTHEVATTSSADNLAYIIYTSGSTGQPKGTLVAQRNLVSAADAWEDAYQLRATVRRHLQMANVTFDVFVGDLVRALAFGGTLVLCPRELLLEPAQLYALIVEHQIDCAEFVPAVLRGLLYHLVDHKLRLDSMRLLVCGSDSWYADEYRQVQAVCGPETRVVNSFGVTEATIDSTWFAAPMLADAPDQLIPIGRPFANTRIYILDRYGQPAPIGIPGELYIGGNGVTRGYLHRPDLTAARFVPDPFTGESGARLYRTGDLARFLPDGTMMFLGRVDQQIKVRGFRIEPDEINAVLEQHPGVQESVVVGYSDPAIGTSIVAYIEPKKHEQPNTTSPAASSEQRDPALDARSVAPGASELRAFLKQMLPDYMIPAAFVLVPTLPRTSSGKVDRRALPKPDIERRVRDAAFVAPRTPAEELVAGVWSSVLGLEHVGAFDNFFALGGHSLLATQVVARLHKAFDRSISLRSLFEAPVVAELAALLTSNPQSEQGWPGVALRRYPRSEKLPLSFAQQRLWFLEQLQPHSPMYLIPLAVRLRGALDLALLERSLTAIVERHEVLRTTFAADSGEPFQVIAAPQPINLQISERPALAEAERAADIQRSILSETQQPMDLEQGPLLRCRVVRFADDDHVLLLTVHHIVFDGWSYAMLTRELIAVYSALAQNQPMPLAELPMQYGDYTQWQREWFAGPALTQQLDYWRQQLAGAPHVLELPSDRPRPPLPSSDGASYPFRLAQPLREGLQRLSQRENATLFMTLLAAFQVLLQRYSGQNDIVIGTPIAGRTRPELEPLIGFFVNTLVLRTDLSGKPRFRELLSRVRETALGAYTHQDLPFEMLVEALQPQRDLSRHPVFQVMFALQNTPMTALSLPELSLQPLAIASATVKFDLSLVLSEQPNGLYGVIEYNTDLFEAATIERMVAHYQRVLSAIVDDPALPIDKLPLLAEDERRRLLVEWNTHALDLPAVNGIHQLFEAQAARTPHALALVFADAHGQSQQLTYAALNARANQLAHYLRAQGIGAASGEHCVAIAMEPSIELIIALLGVLKAGGAYLPLDPSYPAERLQWLLADSEVALVITQQRLLAPAARRLPTAELPVIVLDRDWAQIAAAPSHNPALAIDPDHLAYLIYTSGSTGTPKGVLVAHRGVINNVMAHQADACSSPKDRAMLNYAISFDPAAWNIFWPLSTGAQLVVVPSELRYDTAALVRTIAEQQITILGVSPGHLTALLEEPQITACTALRYVVCGGENLSRELQARFFAKLRAELCNAYGPTEASIDTTLWTCPRVDAPQGGIIGRPLANVQVYVLDRAMQPMPIGVPGELYIGGIGVARGYHRRPDLTAERFLPDPFGHAIAATTPSHGRLYRTGDLVRYRADGAIEFLGRIDDQIKLRGFRIELGEIEALLRQHETVREAVVVVREDRPGDRRLVGYVVAQSQAPSSDRQAATTADTNHAALDTPTLRQFLSTHLPAHMIPSALVVLDALPLTSHGKLDRQALPQPEINVDPALFVAPRDRWELELAQIWQTLLGRAPIGVTESFFEIGGHSLLAVRLIAQIRQQFGRALPLATLFQAPTIALLAARLRAATSDQPWSPLVALQAHGTQQPFFCVHPVGGSVLCYAELARYFAKQRPFYGLQARGVEPGQTPHSSISAMAAEYLVAIRAVQPQGPYLLGGWSLGGLIAWEMARQLQAQGQKVARLVMLDSSPPPPQREPLDQLELLVGFARDLGGLFGKRLLITADELRAQEPAARLDYLLHHARTHGVIPPDVEPEQMQRLAALFQANLHAAHTYTPAPLAQPITLFAADEALGTGARTDLAQQWQSLAPSIEAYTVPGNHYTLLHAPQVQAVAERLERCLNDERNID